MTQNIVRIVDNSLMECMKLKICDKCMCTDSEENPILEIVDEEGFVEERVCMMCYVEELDGEFTV